MAFIDELMKESNPLGITIEEPKAHESIDNEIANNDLMNLPPEMKNLIQGLVMGQVGGGGAGKGIRKLLLAMKGKIKGGKMIPSQPFRHGSIGGESVPSKLDIILNRLKDNPNVGGNIKAVMKENIKRYNK
jgi:hypothetical protein